MNYFHHLPWLSRIGVILVIAIGSHLAITAVKAISMFIIAPENLPKAIRKELFLKRSPKVATVTNLTVSAVTFAIYFFALGLILNEFNISLTAYFATASVFGLAVAFGTQGLVQDVVIGLTFVFSDAFDVGDVIETGGLIGKVDRMGLRFTKISTILNESVYIPNRNMAQVGRFQKGQIRLYADLQLPESVNEEAFTRLVMTAAAALYEQHKALFMGEPDLVGIRDTVQGGWRYLRVRFELWPGQNAIIETTFRQRILAQIRTLHPDYADWMITIVYRA